LASNHDFSVIIKEFAERVYNHAYRMLGTREDAEEATQDVFLKIHKGLNNFRGDAKLSTWIWRITANVCLTRRSNKTKNIFSVEYNLTNELADDNRTANPEKNFISMEGHEDVAVLINKLSPKEAAAITLFYLEEMNYKEISNILEIPMGSVATVLHRGRERLRDMMLKSEGVKL
jgi:RNA polymerase sigma-70 factor (ECF subfamily)